MNTKTCVPRKVIHPWFPEIWRWVYRVSRKMLSTFEEDKLRKYSDYKLSLDIFEKLKHVVS